jgi:ATP-dependent helicase HrpB
MQVSISYEDEVPSIEVKIQEMFGAARGPTIAGGSLAIQLQLMSPATRPAAVTQDLASFWEHSYPAVRKDLAGRYPRHSW